MAIRSLQLFLGCGIALKPATARAMSWPYIRGVQFWLFALRWLTVIWPTRFTYMGPYVGGDPDSAHLLLLAVHRPRQLLLSSYRPLRF